MSRLEKLGLKEPVKKIGPIDEKTKNMLKAYSTDYGRALKKGEEYRQNETKKFGGNPLPGQPGSEKYFQKL